MNHNPFIDNENNEDEFNVNERMGVGCAIFFIAFAIFFTCWLLVSL
jgi:hypothetical protein